MLLTNKLWWEFFSETNKKTKRKTKIMIKEVKKFKINTNQILSKPYNLKT